MQMSLQCKLDCDLQSSTVYLGRGCSLTGLFWADDQVASGIKDELQGSSSKL